MVVSYIQGQLPTFTSMLHPAVAKKGLPRTIRVHASLTISRTTTSLSTQKSPTLTRTSSKMSAGYFAELSTSWSKIGMDYSCPKSSLLKMEYGIKLTLEPRSHKALLILTFLIKQGMKKILGPLSFVGSLLWTTALHSPPKALVSHSLTFLSLTASFSSLPFSSLEPSEFSNPLLKIT